MRRLSIVPLIAAAIVLGHVMPHLLATRCRTSDSRTTRPSPVAGESPPLVAPTCRLQPPPAVADREPMLDALRQLIAREEKRYPTLADNDLTIVGRFDPCGVAVGRHIGVR
jgi:hypothetical protein